jgi:hypothetical protein
MPTYRCNMLDRDGHVMFSADIVAESLSAAIKHACHILKTSNQSNATAALRRVYAFDIEPVDGQVFQERLPDQVGWRPLLIR